ncbi:MAG: RNA methyltransferase [Clostridiales bacterium]|nr:RNA methyltransferase [Clostridiales bacterium]
MDTITSKDNPKVKYLASLHDTKTSRSENAVLVEGLRSCEDALNCGVAPIKVIATERHYYSAMKVSDKYGCECIILSEPCFKKISGTVNPQGLALVFRRPDFSTELELRDDGKDIFLCLEDIQDPGNLGTMIRIADAFDFNAVLVTKKTVDAYNDKVIRSSMGSIWRVPVIEFEDSDAIIDALHEKNINILAAELNGDDLNKANIGLPAAYFIGNEGAGLKGSTIDRCDLKVKIRMQGRAESLNAASAASIMGYILQEIR